MKITTDTPAPQPFVPFTINITIESLEEAQKLHNFFNYTPVCQALYKLLSSSDFFSNFRGAINKGLITRASIVEQETFSSDVAIIRETLQEYLKQ